MQILLLIVVLFISGMYLGGAISLYIARNQRLKNFIKYYLKKIVPNHDQNDEKGYDIAIPDWQLEVFGEPLTLPDKTKYVYHNKDVSDLIKGNVSWSDYKYGKSLIGMNSFFIQSDSNKREKNLVKDPEEIRKKVLNVLGVNTASFGEILNVQKEAVKKNKDGTIHFTELTYSSGSVIQFYTGIPALPNDRIMVALHGCSSSPDKVMGLSGPDYTNNFGLEALKRGWTVIAPYILNDCDHIERFDALGSVTSGMTHFGYELQKLIRLIEYHKDLSSEKSLDIYGISLGGQLAMFLSSIVKQIQGLVVSGAMVLDHYKTSVDRFGNFNNKNARFGTYHSIRRYVVVTDILLAFLERNSKNKLTLEFGSYDVEKRRNRYYEETMKSFNNLVKDSLKISPERVFINYFKGYHETNPIPTLDFLKQEKIDCL